MLAKPGKARRMAASAFELNHLAIHGRRRYLSPRDDEPPPAHLDPLGLQPRVRPGRQCGHRGAGRVGRLAGSAETRGGRAGGVPDKFIKIWPENHFNLTDYTKRIGYWNVFKAYCQSWLFFGTFIIRFPTVLVAWMIGRPYFRQWEPTEQKMDPEVYFRDYESNHSAVDFDHHGFNHRMAKRRAVKWGYAEDVPQLFESHDHH